MNKVSVIHCADIHLGSEIRSLGHLGAKRRAEIKQSFLSILQLCNERKTDFLLLAGDLYENAEPLPELVTEVAEAFAGLKETKVILSPGNHDYVTSKSFFPGYDKYPDNVYVFTGDWDYFDFPDKKVRVWGAAFTGMCEEISILKDVGQTPGEDWLQLGVLHADLVSGASKSSYNPITKQQIQASGLHYLALGHIHMRTEIEKAGSTYYAYCGCHEGRGFDELGEKGIYIGEISTEECRLSFYPVCTRCYLQTEVDLTGVRTDAQAADRIREHLNRQENNSSMLDGDDLEQPGLPLKATEQLYKILLKGTIEEDVCLHFEELKVKLNDFYFVKFRDNLEMAADYEALAGSHSLKGMFVGRMLARIEELEQSGKYAEAKKNRDALRIGMKSFVSEVGYREDI